MSNSLRHFLLDTIPTLLRCSDSFRPSRRMDPTQKFVRRHQHDLTSALVRTPADLVSHHLQDIPEQQLGRKTLSDRTVFLNLSGWSSPAASDPLLPTWMSHRQMRPPVEPTSAHHLCSRGSRGTSNAPRSTRALFLSVTRCVSAILSLYAFIFFPVKVLSMIVLILSRHSSLCGFVAFPCDASDFLRQLQFWSHHLPRSDTQTFPIRRFPSIT